MDPHFVQDATMSISDLNMETYKYFSQEPKAIHEKNIASSFAFGFFLSAVEDFNDFLSIILDLKEKFKNFVLAIDQNSAEDVREDELEELGDTPVDEREKNRGNATEHEIDPKYIR